MSSDAFTSVCSRMNTVARRITDGLRHPAVISDRFPHFHCYGGIRIRAGWNLEFARTSLAHDETPPPPPPWLFSVTNVRAREACIYSHSSDVRAVDRDYDGICSNTGNARLKGEFSRSTARPSLAAADKIMSHLLIAR